MLVSGAFTQGPHQEVGKQLPSSELDESESLCAVFLRSAHATV